VLKGIFVRDIRYGGIKKMLKKMRFSNRCSLFGINRSATIRSFPDRGEELYRMDA
jgi:hypothetical protein